MGGPTVVEAGAYTSDELLARLEDGERLLVRASVLGSDSELTLRYDGDVYYCDSPTTLHRHEAREEMRTCMRHYGYVSDAGS